jgi:hypothetical protein
MSESEKIISSNLKRDFVTSIELEPVEKNSGPTGFKTGSKLYQRE